MKLVENARRVGEEAVALHRAEQCPEGTYTIILDGSQLGLQISDAGEVGPSAVRERVGERGGGCATRARAWSRNFRLRR
jgi:hypothetical protein